MKKCLAVFIVWSSTALATEPVTITIESWGRSSPGWARLVIKAQNNTNNAYGTVFYRCTAFLKDKAIGTQLGIISNLRANGTGFDNMSIEVSQRADSASCRFERVAHSG